MPSKLRTIVFTAIPILVLGLALPAAAGAAQGQGGNSLQSRVAALEALVAQLQADLAAETAARIAAEGALQAAVDVEAATRVNADNDLQAALQTALDDEIAARVAADDALQAAIDVNGVAGIGNVVSLDTSDAAHPKVVFTGVNVQIVDGSGSTISASPNGLGNLIIGYDETRADTSVFRVCSIGPWMTQADCVANGGTWAANHKTGSHNLVVGPEHNYSNSGGVVFGFRNTVNGDSSAVTGGQNGVAGGEMSSITGGNENKVGIRFSTISGGFLNEIRFDPGHVFGASVISGGSFNILQSGEAVIGGGSGCSLTALLGWGAIDSGGTAVGDCQ